MGDYVGVRFKGTVKPEYRNAMKDISMDGSWEMSGIREFNEFGELRRSGFIPCGSLSYMPDEWHNEEFEREYNLETGDWSFKCSLKDPFTLKSFFNLIPFFIEELEYLEYYDELEEYSQKYELIKGKVIIVNEKFIDYSFDC